MVKKIDVFLLAAGESSRMFPLSTIMEKSLLPVDGKPVIRHIVDNLTENPQTSRLINCIFICCLKKFEKQFVHEFRDMPDIQIGSYDKPKGTFSTFTDAMLSRSLSEWAMIHYADCMTDIDYADFISSIDSNSSINGIIAVTNKVKHDYSEVSFTTDNTVQDFVEKPNVMNYSWSGIGLFKSDKTLKYFGPFSEDKDFAFDVFPKMIEEGSLRAYPYNGYWYDMGNLNSYRKICNQYNGEK